ncbi:hypothetical protein ACB316_16570 [Aeromonas sanarellii]
MKWLVCDTDFIVSDVIRWREPVWKPQPRHSKKKPVILGQRVITGQIVKIDRGGWVHIDVTACTVEPSPHCLRPLQPLKRGEAIRRQKGKIGRGRIDRMAWSDETARAAVVGSRFVKV